MHLSPRPRPCLLVCGALLLCGAQAAEAATKTLTIRGRGFGHGVGMSQYGAYGYASKGVGYAEILGHYYTGTALATLPASRTVRVLLASGRSSVRVRGAALAGTTKLDPRTTYVVRSNGLSGTSVSGSGGGGVVARSSGPLELTGARGGPVTVLGRAGFGVSNGRWRGTVEVRTATVGGLDVVNDVPVDDYVRGVVAAEMPASWPAEALKVQAVAARTYALTTDAGSTVFDQYPDTRSQVYKGVAGETAASDAAVAATARQVVTYAGKPAVTYFFSTSGGETENVENGFPGAKPQPWLKGVDDPYDDLSPRHRWGPFRFTMAAATAKLSGLVKGRLVSIKVLKRGVSPRIVKAQLIGTGGRTTVTGATLRARFGLYDTWATFSFSGKAPTDAPPPSGATGPTGPTGDPSTGGISPTPGR